MPLLNALSKVRIQADDGTSLTAHFNPTSLTVATGAEWKAQPTTASKDAPAAQFLGTKPRTIKMDFLFDNSWLGLVEALLGMDDGVSKQVQQLLDWTNPTAASRGTKQPNPPKLTVFWGDHTLVAFTVYLDSVSAVYSEFAPTGQPTRATVAVGMTEIPSNKPGQNPTSGTIPGRRTHLVTAGDTLHSIAHREYGKPALWRGLANVNGIDDPLRVPVGTSILVPPREDAENNA
jgi:Contractile injection system tube protein